MSIFDPLNMVEEEAEKWSGSSTHGALKNKLEPSPRDYFSGRPLTFFHLFFSELFTVTSITRSDL
jgi:hypothetical protein